MYARHIWAQSSAITAVGMDRKIAYETAALPAAQVVSHDVSSSSSTPAFKFSTLHGLLRVCLVKPYYGQCILCAH